VNGCHDQHRASVQPHPPTHPFNGPLSGTTWVSRYHIGKSNLNFTEARDSEWQWHQLGCMQVCTSLQTDNHASTPPLSFLQAGCPSCHPTNSVKALKASTSTHCRQIQGKRRRRSNEAAVQGIRNCVNTTHAHTGVTHGQVRWLL